MSSIALPRPNIAGRAAYGVIGVAAAVAAAVVFSPWVIALWLVPDVVLVGAFEGTDGRLRPRAVARYNAVHAVAGPLVLAAAGAVAGSGLVLALGLMWLSHVTLDRAMGFNLRAADGSQRA